MMKAHLLSLLEDDEEGSVSTAGNSLEPSRTYYPKTEKKKTKKQKTEPL